MDMTSWAIDIENTIFSIIKAKTEKDLKTIYPSILFTMDNSTQTQTTFPTIYFHFLQSQERGLDLAGETINGLFVSVDISVIVNSKIGMQGAKTIQKALLKAFKELRFECKLPSFDNDSSTDIKISTARYSRVIGQGTIL